MILTPTCSFFLCYAHRAQRPQTEVIGVIDPYRLAQAALRARGVAVAVPGLIVFACRGLVVVHVSPVPDLDVVVLVAAAIPDLDMVADNRDAGGKVKAFTLGPLAVVLGAVPFLVRVFGAALVLENK